MSQMFPRADQSVVSREQAEEFRATADEVSTCFDPAYPEYAMTIARKGNVYCVLDWFRRTPPISL